MARPTSDRIRYEWGNSLDYFIKQFDQKRIARRPRKNHFDIAIQTVQLENRDMLEFENKQELEKNIISNLHSLKSAA
ncbi:MAG: hypothetical protein IPH93_12150 [Saprospiraceae bacterium]|nr:hypothetical protein [Saprospiraceae bacterium]